MGKSIYWHRQLAIIWIESEWMPSIEVHMHTSYSHGCIITLASPEKAGNNPISNASAVNSWDNSWILKCKSGSLPCKFTDLQTSIAYTFSDQYYTVQLQVEQFFTGLEKYTESLIEERLNLEGVTKLNHIWCRDCCQRAEGEGGIT